MTPMPNPLSQSAARLDAALERANLARFRAVHMRSLAELSAWPAVWLSEAAKADARADSILLAMKEGAA